jgi:hypothetical protein
MSTTASVEDRCLALLGNDSYNDKGLVGTAEAVPFPSLISLKADG